MDQKNFIHDHMKRYNKDEAIENIFEIILDDKYKFPEIREVDKLAMESYPNINLLALNYCGLKSLNNLPKYDYLEVLELTDNNFSGDELAKIPYTTLYKIKLSNNKISTLEQLSHLTKQKDLKVLELHECPIQKIEGYREKVFKMFPSLHALDMIDRSGNEYNSEDDEEDEDGEIIGDEDEDYDLDDEELEEEEGDEDDEDDEEEENPPSKKKKM